MQTTGGKPRGEPLFDPRIQVAGSPTKHLGKIVFTRKWHDKTPSVQATSTRFDSRASQKDYYQTGNSSAVPHLLSGAAMETEPMDLYQTRASKIETNKFDTGSSVLMSEPNERSLPAVGCHLTGLFTNKHLSGTVRPSSRASPCSWKRQPNISLRNKSNKSTNQTPLPNYSLKVGSIASAIHKEGDMKRQEQFQKWNLNLTCPSPKQSSLSPSSRGGAVNFPPSRNLLISVISHNSDNSQKASPTGKKSLVVGSRTRKLEAPSMPLEEAKIQEDQTPSFKRPKMVLLDSPKLPPAFASPQADRMSSINQFPAMNSQQFGRLSQIRSKFVKKLAPAQKKSITASRNVKMARTHHPSPAKTMPEAFKPIAVPEKDELNRTLAFQPEPPKLNFARRAYLANNNYNMAAGEKSKESSVESNMKDEDEERGAYLKMLSGMYDELSQTDGLGKTLPAFVDKIKRMTNKSRTRATVEKWKDKSILVERPSNGKPAKFKLTGDFLKKVEDSANKHIDKIYQERWRSVKKVRQQDTLDIVSDDESPKGAASSSAAIRDQLNLVKASERVSKDLPSMIQKMAGLNPATTRKSTRNIVKGLRSEEDFRSSRKVANKKRVPSITSYKSREQVKAPLSIIESDSSKYSTPLCSTDNDEDSDKAPEPKDAEVDRTLNQTSPETKKLLNGLFKEVKEKEQQRQAVTVMKGKIKEMIEANAEELAERAAPKSRLQRTNRNTLVLRKESILFSNTLPANVKNMISPNVFREAKGSFNLGLMPVKTAPTENTFKKIREKVSQLIMKKRELNIYQVFKLAVMVRSLEEIMPDKMTLGARYERDGVNIWKNEAARKAQTVLKGKKGHFRADFDTNHSTISNIDAQFSRQVAKDFFFSDVKKAFPEDKALSYGNHQYLRTCEKSQVLPVPAFAKVIDGILYLAEFRMSEHLGQAMHAYLKSTMSQPQLAIQQLFIDDCGMTDSQFSLILEGIILQGSSLTVLSYSNNEFGEKSAKSLLPLLPSLRELNIVNNTSTKDCQRPYEQLLEEVLASNFVLQKLKLSHIFLNHASLLNLLCLIIDEKDLLTSLDLSWTKLSPAHLRQISQTILECPNKIKNLNLSYNSLWFGAPGEPKTFLSEGFVEDIEGLLGRSNTILHLNFSGMNLSFAAIEQIAQAVTASSTMMALHLSDCGLRSDELGMSSILDIFRLRSDGSQCNKARQFFKNCPVSTPKLIQDTVKKYTGTAVEENETSPAPTKVDNYKKFTLRTIQAKTVQMNKSINQIVAESGIGRINHSQIDNFVLTRVVNGSELAFNQHHEVDAYFQDESSHKWTLSQSNECYYCHKHRFTMIFFEQRQAHSTVNHNGDLVEVTDKKLVQEIEASLNLGVLDEGETAPIVVGTVVNDRKRGFSRKLRMMRADLFSMLCVCQSRSFVTKKQQVKDIKRGVQSLLEGCQQRLPGEIPYFSKFGQVIFEKAKKNQAQDVCSVNFPKDITQITLNEFGMALRPSQCSTYVYAAYLPPGKHQFLIYCPVTKKAYCKDLIVDLNQFDLYPEYPLTLEDPKSYKTERQNVWKDFREDTDQDMAFAFNEDIKVSFNPENFLKERGDVDDCKQILLNNFRMLQVAYVEGLADSPQTYPEVFFLTFLNKILSQQKTEKEKKRLKRSMIELAFISATRGDDARGLGGTLCRGEFMEVTLRLCNQVFPRQRMAPHLQGFLDVYFRGIYEESKQISDRAVIRSSRSLNHMLFDNAKGLKILFRSHQIKGKFTFESAMKLLSIFSANPKVPSEACFQAMRIHFVYSKMTNLLDLEECEKYFSLVYVEFLELICRFTISYWEDPINEGKTRPASIFKMVEHILLKLWEHRQKVSGSKTAMMGSITSNLSKQLGRFGKGIKASANPDEFPQFVTLDEEDD